MTRRVTFTQAELRRAIRVADEMGKVAVATPQGIVFADAGSVALPSPDHARGNSCDEAFGVGN